MVCKLAFKLPLRRCECGGKARLNAYVTISGKHAGWFIGCDRYFCNRMATKIYKYPFIAVIKWNLKDWRYSKDNNRYLKGER